MYIINQVKAFDQGERAADYGITTSSTMSKACLSLQKMNTFIKPKLYQQCQEK